MSSKEKQIRNKYNTIIGWCKEFPDRVIATHYRKGFVGCYTKGTDVTTDSKGYIYCYGDGTADLVREADKEYTK